MLYPFISSWAEAITLMMISTVILTKSIIEIMNQWCTTPKISRDIHLRLKKNKKKTTWHINKSLRSFDGLPYRSKIDMKPTAQTCVI